MTTATRLARSVSSWFRKQREHIKQTGIMRAYGQTSQLANELTDVLVNSYLAGLKVAKADTDRVEEALAQAKIHAQDLARQLNDATANMLADGRPLGEIFGSDRAALVGVEEDYNARQRSLSIAVKGRGNGLRWDVDTAPCTDICKPLAGKIVKPGDAFTIVNGKPIYHPSAHPG